MRCLQVIGILFANNIDISHIAINDHAVSIRSFLYMQIVLGPFHPYLEHAFVEEVLACKADPLFPLLILVPSDALRRHLKILLTRPNQLSFINLQLLTFHQLSLRLLAEADGVHAGTLHEDLFFEETLRQLIESGEPGTEAFHGIIERTGGCPALWQTLRDLRDGLVDPAMALEALSEGTFAQRTSRRTSDLLALLETMLRFCAEKGLRDRSDIERAATAHARNSDFLKQSGRIFFYGFYDLTQIQVDLFHAVAHYPTTLFFPLLSIQPSHKGWSFAENFYQRYVQGRGGADNVRNLPDETKEGDLPLTLRLFDQQSERKYGSSAADWRCQIFDTLGIHDEVTTVAKEILGLLDDTDMAFDEIGVVSRTLEGYGPTIKEVFAQHQIPIAGAIEEPLVQFPIVKAAILLLHLPARDYVRSDVIDLLSSPYFQLSGCMDHPTEFRVDLCDLASRELAICKGIQEWEKLAPYTTAGMTLHQISDDEIPRVTQVPAAQLTVLLTIVRKLSVDLGHLPARASWSYYAKSWKGLLEKYLGIASESGADNTRPNLISDKIVETLEQIAALDAIQSEISLSRFSETFQRWLERCTIRATDKNTAGVTVSNATTARGLSYRALFILGLNEGVFPRTIREDAFLRDRDREVLERDLGYKVSQKLAAFEEEKLIFTLLVNAARERLYCSFQRADETGRTLSPSWYLGELKRALASAGQEQVIAQTIPRGITDKASMGPFDREELLVPEELAVRLSLTGRDAQSLIDAVDLSSDLYKQGVENIRKIDLSTEKLDVFDGLIRSPTEHWHRLTERGLSPTRLELYARCPFQYFARQVLGLQRLETPEVTIGPSPAEIGEIGHSILKLTYHELIESGYFIGKAQTINTDAVLSLAAETAFAEYEATNPIGYPLIWDTLRETLIQILREVVNRDLQELALSGYVPVAVEADLKDRLPGDWPEPLKALPVHGRVDRIDIDPVHDRLRVVDYKFKFSAQPSSEDNDLCRAALRGERLQPPLYTVLGHARSKGDHRLGAEVQVSASFYYIAARWSEGPLFIKSFSAQELSGKTGEAIKQTISQLASGIQSGQFYLQRGDHCPYCEVAEICRKNHPPSLWRAENDPLTARHRQLREKDPTHL
jgi:ATP-dependent helicase/nuclease subunit B